MDRTWRFSSYLRNLLRQGGNTATNVASAFRLDLAALELVAQMGSWQPNYVDLDPSQERLAEMVLKLEREVYGIKRPASSPIATSSSSIGEPIDLGQFIPAYLDDPHAIAISRRKLRTLIQSAD